MGGGTYCSTLRSVRADSLGYTTKSFGDVFTKRSIEYAMNPKGVEIRESRDSEEHPESLAIIIGLDVTGSMGSTPHKLVKDGLPTIMDNILGGGVKDPQVLFLGIGDHECDSAPLQVGQFESNDEAMDKWLTSIYMEGGGGGNDGESYLLAWYFAACHTSIDCFEKRGKKGILFTIGDEPVLSKIPQQTLKQIMGCGEPKDYLATELLDKARKMYDVYHIHVAHNSWGNSCIDGWRELIGDNLLVAQNVNDVLEIIARTIENNYKPLASVTKTETDNGKEEIIL